MNGISAGRPRNHRFRAAFLDMETVCTVSYTHLDVYKRQAMGCGRQKADAKDFEELNLEMNLLPKIHVMTVVWDEDLEEILVELQQKLTTGSVGDGKIFISTIDDVVRIRTGERGYCLLYTSRCV